MNKLLNFLTYLCLSILLSCILSFITSMIYGTSFIEGLFWIGIIIVALGGMSSITGNATGTSSGISQYEGFANIESLYIDRETTSYYKNFKKQIVFDPKISGLGVILSGIILITIGFLFQ